MEEIQRLKKRKQIFALLPVFLLQFNNGMHAAFPAILTPQLRDECSEINIGTDEESWIVCLDSISSTAFCIIFGILQHRLGPKKVLILGCFPYFAAWLLTAFPSSVIYLYGARFLVGIGHATVLTTIYTTEVTSTEMRASFTLAEDVACCVGALTIFTLGAFVNWKIIAQGSTLFPFLAMIMIFFVPESPTFLVRKDKIEDAKNSLHCLYGPQYNVDNHIMKIKNSLLKGKKSQQVEEQKATEGVEHEGALKIWHDIPLEDCSEVKNSFNNNKNSSLSAIIREKVAILRSPVVTCPFGIIFLLTVVQQFSGMTILRAYIVKISNNIFSQSANINATADALSTINCTDSTLHGGVRIEAFYSAIILGTNCLITLLVLTRLIQKIPRRKMFFLSAISTAISLVGVATFSCVVANFELEPSTSTILKWCTLASSSALTFSVHCGVQTFPSLLAGELFPSEVRAFCKSVFRSFSRILNAVSLKAFPFLESSMTFYGTFYLMAAVMVSSIPVVSIVLPETKDVDLEMIQNLFKKQKTVFYIDLDPSDVEKNNNPPEQHSEINRNK